MILYIQQMNFYAQQLNIFYSLNDSLYSVDKFSYRTDYSSYLVVDASLQQQDVYMFSKFTVIFEILKFRFNSLRCSKDCV